MRKLLIAVVAFVAMQSGAFAAERDVIERAKLAFSEQLRLTSSSSSAFEWIAEDAVYQYPLGDINVKLRVEGRDAISEHLRALVDFAPNTDVANIEYFPTLDRDVVFVRYDLLSAGDGGKLGSRMVIVTMRGDQIAGLIQLNGSQESLQVLRAAVQGGN